MSVTFNFDVPEIMGKIEAANQEAIEEMGEQILADSNKLAPWGEHDLIESSLNNSDLKNGIIIWDTPYAQYLYYGVLMVGEKSHSSWAKRGEKKEVKTPEQMLNFAQDHQNSQMLWYEKAKDINLDQWITTYQKAFNNARRK